MLGPSLARGAGIFSESRRLSGRALGSTGSRLLVPGRPDQYLRGRRAHGVRQAPL